MYLVIASGSGVGGGSLGYANTLYHAPARFYDDAQWAGLNDWQVAQRHKLAPLTIFTLDAKVNDNAPEKYRGLDRYLDGRMADDRLLLVRRLRQQQFERGHRNHPGRDAAF